MAISLPGLHLTRAERQEAHLNDVKQTISSNVHTDLAAAGTDTAAAGNHALSAFANVLGAGVNVVRAGGNVVGGAVLTADAGVDVAEGALLATVSGGVYLAEDVQKAFAGSLKGASHGFADMAGVFAHIRDDGNTITSRSVKSQDTRTAASVLLAMAKNQFGQAKFSTIDAGKAYANALADALGAGANVVEVAAHLLGTTGHLLAAGIEAGVAGLEEVGVLSMDVAKISVAAADEGLEGAENLCVAGAKVTANLANKVKANDQDGIKLEIHNTRDEYVAQLKATLNNPKNAGKFSPSFAATAQAFIAENS